MTTDLGSSYALYSDEAMVARLAAAAPQTRLMRDTSNPAGKDIGAQVAAGYLRSATPHTWTTTDWQAQSARWLLPIYVPDNPNTGQAEGIAAADELRALGWPTGTTVGWDLETHQWQGEVTAAAAVLALAGYHLMPYGSTSTLFTNPPVAGYWVADWTNQPHLYPHAGVVATQYQAGVTMANGVVADLSLIVASVPLRDAHPLPGPGTGLADLHMAAGHLITAGQLLQRITHLP